MTTDREAIGPGQARRMKKDVKRFEKKEVKDIVVECAKGLPARKVRSIIVCKEDDVLQTEGKHL